MLDKLPSSPIKQALCLLARFVVRKHNLMYSNKLNDGPDPKSVRPGECSVWLDFFFLFLPWPRNKNDRYFIRLWFCDYWVSDEWTAPRWMGMLLLDQLVPLGQKCHWLREYRDNGQLVILLRLLSLSLLAIKESFALQVAAFQQGKPRHILPWLCC